jgi:ABC-type multidrug transport system ATPase subunit
VQVERSPLLSLQGITKRWPGADRPVLDAANLALEPGVAIHLSGPNGAGKTTLLRISAGLIRPDMGSVRLGDLDVERDRTAFHRKVGFLSAGSTGLYARLTVTDHLRLWSRLALMARCDREAAFERVVARFDLASLADRRVDRLSMGQRQRVRLAGVFLPGPQMALLDEPTTSLDEPGTELIAREADRTRREGGAVLWCAPSLDVEPPGGFDAHLTLRDCRIIAS